MSGKGYVAFDLGAESGRAMLATLADGKLTLDEAHRFANLPQRLPSGYHWNLLDLWANLVTGLGRCAALAKERAVELAGVGVDTWGVDFALLGKSGQLLGLPYAYRDERNGPAMKRAFKKIGRKNIYRATGIQFMPFNSLFQLVAQQQSEPAVLDHARHLLFIPDLLHYFFSGEMLNEATIASTSQMVDPRKSQVGKWARSLLKDLDLPRRMLGEIVPAGTKVGKLLPAVAAQAGVGRLPVIAPGSHDTASAVAAVPVTKGGPWAYISSGTWSLMGAELDEPVINAASLEASFTNERGVEGKIRFLKNIAGLWLVQEVRRDFTRRGQEYDYAKLTELAAVAPPFRTIVNPDHEPFAMPGDMCAKIDAFAKATGQPAPENVGQYVRCCLESLALTYRHVLDLLERILGCRVEVLHVVGGGGRNTLLNQMTADAISRPVIVGPFEATAVGNALTQAIGTDDVRDLAELRAIVRQSFDPVRYEPRDAGAFEGQRQRFEALRG